MGYNVFALCVMLTLTLTVPLTVSVELYPPKPMGTLTINDWSFTDEETTERNLTDLPAPDTCHPLYVGAMLRHGARNPTVSAIVDATALMERIGGHILAPQYSHLNSYVFPFDIDNTLDLVPVGYQENVGMGRRFALRMQELLGNAAEDELRLISSYTERNFDSARAFRQGLFEILDKFGNNTIVENNTLTRYFEECDRYVVGVDENPDTYEEERKYFNGTEMRTLSRTLSDRLQLNVSDLTPGFPLADLEFPNPKLGAARHYYWPQRSCGQAELIDIFSMVALEEGVLGASNWTGVFNSSAELDVLDYYEDFEEYWARGYAYPITYEMTCVVLEEMFKEMDEARSANQANSSSHPKATFMFGHSSSIVPFECLLGLFNDSTLLPILTDNYDQQANRSFRGSRIGSMAANVALVLYECEEGETDGTPPDGVDWPPTLDRYMVQMMYKEMSTKITNTCGYDLCPYDDVRSHFEEYVDRCNFNQRCALTAASDHNSPIVLVTLAAILSVFTATR